MGALTQARFSGAEETMTECDYEELSHTAEVGLRVRGAAPAALFACAAIGMFGLIGGRPGNRDRRRLVTVESLDAESLLVDWLSELLYLHETTGEVYDHCEVTTWLPTRLEAVIEGGRLAGQPLRAIKAVTYHGLRLYEAGGAWVAEVYFDI
ncbi:MAG: archease [Ardenticatenaceae bacterium]|nr:archease [Ardenticatenaceae bacterium]HBY97593.1 hypothetical protein [Chloroflexota bacterium]